jgi:zinc transporter ZupT
MKNNLEKHFVVYLTSFFSITSVIYLFAVTFLTVPKDNHRVVDTILGFLMGTLIATIINYYLGSSKGSADKNKIIDKEPIQ